MLWSALSCVPYNVQSQSLGSLFGKLGESVALGAILKNPNLQSQDMRNYIAYVNSGDNCINNAKYADAMSYYKEASNIINRTYDGNLKKLYFNYGWGDALKQSYDYAYSKYKLQQPQTILMVTVEVIIMCHPHRLREITTPIQQLPKAELVICAMEQVER